MALKHFAFKYVPIVVVCGILCDQTGQLKADEKADLGARMQTDTPAMPLLAKWRTVLHEGKAPIPAGKLSLLSPKPLPLVNWDFLFNDDVTRLEVKFYNSKRAALINLEYVPNARDKVTCQFFHWDGHTVQPKQWDLVKMGWLQLLDNPDFPLAMGTPNVKDSEWLKPKRPSRALYRIEAKDNQILRHPLSGPEQQRADKSVYELVDDPKTEARVIYNARTGERVARTPPSNASFARRVSVVGRKIILAGRTIYAEFERFRPELIWYISSDMGKTWHTTKLHLGRDYLGALLPRGLEGMRIDPEQRSDFTVLEDGSIIFRLETFLRQDKDRLRGIFLIRQPLRGKGKILSWEMHHVFEPSVSYEDNSWQARQERAAARTFDHVWYPGENGTIESRYLKTDMGKDFFFDVDTANNIVTYLLGGQLWALDLSESQSSTKSVTKPEKTTK